MGGLAYAIHPISRTFLPEARRAACSPSAWQVSAHRSMTDLAPNTAARPSRDDLKSDLLALAYNLRWSWVPDVQDLFATLAPETWKATYNPLDVIGILAQDSAAVQAQAERIRAARRDLDAYLAAPGRLADAPRVAYLSAEFAIAECLPIYSGGLGVLAGDHLKGASDLGVPLIGIGLLYQFGYFRQVIDPTTGWQREHYLLLEPETRPLHQMRNPDGSLLRIAVPFSGRAVQAQVWCAQVGRVPLYLLDTDLLENPYVDRWVTGHLYGGDQDTRIRQELVLGIGGARLIQALGAQAQPDVVHMNEGHAAFVALELARQRMEDGRAASFEEAAAQVAPRLVFTTHTPVPAGHDAFPQELMETYFSGYRAELGLSLADFMDLGDGERGARPTRFSMTVLALRSASYRNAVSQLHGVVSREMWHHVGLGSADAPAAEPMAAITNGVHSATWVGPEMGALFDQQLGLSWREYPDDPNGWTPLQDLDPVRLWQARTAQRARLLNRADALAREHAHAGLAVPRGEDGWAERVLVVGFARRFATYKRAALLLENPDRLHAILTNPDRPVILLFAGKAHPRDDPGKRLMQRIVEASHSPRFRGHVLFLEGYEIALARELVQGADVWLNTPRRPMEASGTSGMKAALNGAQHLSELDGWWDEAYRPELGWALGTDIPGDLPAEEVDRREADQLIDLLEREVVPLFFERGADGLPRAWIQRVAASIRALGPQFSMHRQVVEYAERLYGPAARTAPRQTDLPSSAPVAVQGLATARA